MGAHLTWTAAVLAWVLAVPLYVITKHVSTVAHEGGHALVATLLFQKVEFINLNRDGSGLTKLGSAAPWLFAIPFFLAGYLGPSIFGLLAVALLIHGVTVGVLWGSVGFLVVMFFAVRGWFGRLIVPVLIAAIVWLATQVHQPVQLLLTHVWVWFLLIVPVESMIAYLTQALWRHPGSDTAKLRDLTYLPSPLWALLQFAGTAAALVYGGSLLLRHAG